MKKFFIRLFGAVMLTVAVAVAISFVTDRNPENPDPVTDTSVGATALTDLGSPYKFWFSQLNNDGKTAYNMILSSIYSMPSEIPVNRIDSETLDEVFYALLNDNPDLFFVGRKCRLRTHGLKTSFSVDYTVSEDDYLRMKAELDSVCDKIASTHTDKSDLWQTELEIHDYIIDNCEYSLENSVLGSTAYGALIKGKAACEGYAKAAKLLLDAAGIENVLVSGYAENGNGPSGAHMWNAVRLGGNWYNLDCTWDDPVDESGKQSKNYLYFNVDNKTLSLTHSDFSHTFDCNSLQENYFVRTGAYFESYDRSKEKALADIVIKEIKAGNDTVHFRFADKKAFDEAINDLLGNERIYRILELTKKTSDLKILTNETGYFTDEEHFVFALAPKFEQE